MKNLAETTNPKYKRNNINDIIKEIPILDFKKIIIITVIFIKQHKNSRKY